MAQAAAAAATAATTTVLVVNDDEEARKLQQEALTEEGFEVITASERDEAEEVLNSGKADIAVLDIHLSEKADEADTSGLDLAEMAGSGTSKVLITVWPNPEIRRRAEQLKAESKIDDFIFEADQRTDAILKAVWKAVAHRMQIRVGEAVQSELHFMALRRHRARFALVCLLAVFTSSMMAVYTKNPWWIVGTISCAALSVIFISMSTE